MWDPERSFTNSSCSGISLTACAIPSRIGRIEFCQFLLTIRRVKRKSCSFSALIMIGMSCSCNYWPCSTLGHVTSSISCTYVHDLLNFSNFVEEIPSFRGEISKNCWFKPRHVSKIINNNEQLMQKNESGEMKEMNFEF